MMRPSWQAWVGLVAVLVLAGCAGSNGNDGSPAGPSKTFSGAVGGSQTSTEEFEIPPNTPSLRIALRYSIGGTGRFELYDPNGQLKVSKTYSGGAAGNYPSWFEMRDPPAGQWRLRMQLEGGVTYNAEVYWGEPGPVAPIPDEAQADTVATTNPSVAQWVAIGGGIGVGVLAMGFVATEFGRFKALSGLAGLGLFSRLEKDDVLAHEKREQVYQFIKDNPGPSFSDILRELELSNGTLVHHLRILEAQEFVKAHRDGFRTRFYLRGPKVVPSAYLTRTQQQILDAIGAHPGVTQKELSGVLRLPREAVSYHTKRLAAQGQLQVRQEGKWRRYWRVGASPPGPNPQPS